MSNESEPSAREILGGTVEPGFKENELAPAPAQPPPINVDTEKERQDCLSQGRALANQIMCQLQRCSVALFNNQEAKNLEMLRADFQKWANAAARYPALTEEIPNYRDFLPAIDLAPLFRPYKRALSIKEELILQGYEPQREPRREADYGMWSGLPRAI